MVVNEKHSSFLKKCQKWRGQISQGKPFKSSPIFRSNTTAYRRGSPFPSALSKEHLYWRGKLSAVDLLVLTSADHLPFILKILFTLFTKQATLMRGVNGTETSTTDSLPQILLTGLERLAMDKRSSLFGLSVTRKKTFYNINTRKNSIQTTDTIMSCRFRSGSAFSGSCSRMVSSGCALHKLNRYSNLIYKAKLKFACICNSKKPWKTNFPVLQLLWPWLCKLLYWFTAFLIIAVKTPAFMGFSWNRQTQDTWKGFPYTYEKFLASGWPFDAEKPVYQPVRFTHRYPREVDWSRYIC